jgi:prepilin-type N-terminal cleavage/methylation domain-containing protein
MTTAITPAGWDSRRARGFTVIELMVVLAVATVLTSVLLPAVQRLRETQHSTFREKPPDLHSCHDTFGVIPPLRDPLENEIDALAADQSSVGGAGSTQTLAWGMVVAATSADPAGSLDQNALNALYQNLLVREASIQGLIGRVDALLATEPCPDARHLLLADRDALVEALDGVRKMKAVLQSHVSAGVAAP